MGTCSTRDAFSRHPKVSKSEMNFKHRNVMEAVRRYCTINDDNDYPMEVLKHSIRTECWFKKPTFRAYCCGSDIILYNEEDDRISFLTVPSRRREMLWSILASDKQGTLTYDECNYLMDSQNYELLRRKWVESVGSPAPMEKEQKVGEPYFSQTYRTDGPIGKTITTSTVTTTNPGIEHTTPGQEVEQQSVPGQLPQSREQTVRQPPGQTPDQNARTQTFIPGLTTQRNVATHTIHVKKEPNESNNQPRETQTFTNTREQPKETAFLP